MGIQSLNGIWKYRIGRGEYGEIAVPFSRLPVGHSECVRLFDLEESGERVLLRFDGITYAARVWLNGVELGEMLAYSEYTFEVTELVRPVGNELRVELEDITPAFGPTEGWENYGGIIRGVSLLYKSRVYIEDVFFRSTLTDRYTNAEFAAGVTLNGGEGELEISLLRDGREVDRYIQQGGEACLRRLCGVELWSPDAPSLYTLCVRLSVNGETVDEYGCDVGFREFSCGRHRFLLNGEPIFLQGVCRHEMIGDSGHVVSAEQIEKDMQMIKDAGCNFVRLVHYPHCRETLEIADRIGLMVSEEPGLWWSDTSDPRVAGGSLEVLGRTVRRDRNHPSIIFWLCFNECIFTEEFLVESARVCRENDPTRLVSGANCMSDEDTLKYYNICGFDFYTMHPYSATFDRAAASAGMLCDKPLMFTEWGGYFVYDNPHLITEFIEQMYALYENGGDGGALAGACFWYWAEVNDLGRGEPACVDGVLKEALVDKDRRPTMIYKPYFDAWKRAGDKKAAEERFYFTELSPIDGEPLEVTEGDRVTPEEVLRTLTSTELLPRFATMRGRKISVGPMLARAVLGSLDRVPYLLADGDRLVLRCGLEADKISLIGMVSLPKGYPIGGEYGELAATVTVRYSDGRAVETPIRNGIELSCVYASLGSSRIDPRAERAERVFEFGYDKNFENYVINRLDIAVDGRVETVEISSADKGYGILIWGAIA